MKIAMLRKRNSRLLPVLMVFGLLACDLIPAKKVAKSDDSLSSIKVDFANVYIPVPAHFKQFKADILLKTLSKEQNPIDEIVKRILIGYESEGNKYILLHDTTYMNNFIHFESLEFLPLSKEISELILAKMKAGMNATFRNSDINYAFLEQKYFGGSQAQIMKVKYEMSIPGKRLWLTEYLISTQKHTFKATHFSEFVEDIEANIKSMKMY